MVLTDVSLVALLAEYWNFTDQVDRLQQRLRKLPPRRAGREPRPVRRLRRLSDDEVEDLVAAREAGAQISELAKQFRVHRATVIAHLERAGVPGRRWPGRTLTPEEVPEAARLYESGLSLVAVGERFGVDKRQVARALREAGVEIRVPGRRRREATP